MSYMWNEFNIKTFPAETVVYRDGVFCPELSTLSSADVIDTQKLPVHFIYLGEIAGKNELNLNISAENQKCFLTIQIKNKKPAFLNIFVKNAGKNSSLRGHILLENENELNFDITAHHMMENTEILIDTKIIAGKNTVSKLIGTSIIDKNTENTVSDIKFTALSGENSKIEFAPRQKIKSIPENAGHSAAMFKIKPAQIQYLRAAGLGTLEINDVMRAAFRNDFNLF